ncbi:MAG: glycosyltransferase [Parcubacteria group bacterium]|nr:glycosyltransferase [Parcubacteria group bacterium]
MKIGFFTDVYTPQIDGVVKSINLYKEALEDLGHEVFIFAPKSIKRGSIFDFIFKKEKNVFRFYAVDSLFIPGYPLTLPISYRSTRAIPKLKLDIVHCHTPLSMGMLGDMVALMSNVPQVFTYHTYYSEYAKHYFNLGKLKEPTSKVIRKLESFYCNRADLVLAPSDKLKNVLENKMEIQTDIKVLPTGLKLEEFEKISEKGFRNKYKIPADKKILLYVGRVGPEKNVKFLIEMLPKVLAEKDALLVIAGEGKEKNNLEKLVSELQLEDKILFLGVLPRKETIKAFKSSDIFVFSSLTDTQGLVLSEAAAASKPIVLLRDPGLTPLVSENKNAFLSSEDKGEFAEHILKLLRDDNLYDNMARNSLEIAKKFSIEAQAKELIKHYEELIKNHKSSSWRAKTWSKMNKKIEIPFNIGGGLKKFKNLFK